MNVSECSASVAFFILPFLTLLLLPPPDGFHRCWDCTQDCRGFRIDNHTILGSFLLSSTEIVRKYFDTTLSSLCLTCFCHVPNNNVFLMTGQPRRSFRLVTYTFQDPPLCSSTLFYSFVTVSQTIFICFSLSLSFVLLFSIYFYLKHS
jgi:hypothetical protein